MDGVIIDSEPWHKKIEKELLEELGGTITDEEYTRFVGTTDHYMWSTFKKQFNLHPSVDEIINIKKNKFMNQIHKIPLVNNVKNVIDAFVAEGYFIGLASSNNRNAVDKVIDHFGLTNYFQVSMSGEDITYGKPNPEIFLKTAEALKVDPAECVVIEDAENGVKAAKAAGMKCIGLNNPNSGEQDLSMADMFIDSYEELNLKDIKSLFQSSS